MHVHFNPDTLDFRPYFEAQLGGAGRFVGGGAYFVGYPYQRGGGLGSVFRSIFRFLLPALKQVGAELGREGLATGARVLDNLATSGGKNLRKAVITETAQGLRNVVGRTQPSEMAYSLINDAEGRLHQRGGQQGGGRKRRAPMRSTVSLTTKRARGRSVRNKRLDALGYY